MIRFPSGLLSQNDPWFDLMQFFTDAAHLRDPRGVRLEVSFDQPPDGFDGLETSSLGCSCSIPAGDGMPEESVQPLWQPVVVVGSLEFTGCVRRCERNAVGVPCIVVCVESSGTHPRLAGKFLRMPISTLLKAVYRPPTQPPGLVQ